MLSSVLARWSKALPGLATRLTNYRPTAPLTTSVNPSELPAAPIQQQIRHFHGLVQQSASSCCSTALPQVTQQRNFKPRHHLRLFCENCYYITYRDRKMVMCKSYVRHKQIKKPLSPQSQWIVAYDNNKIPRIW